MYKESNLNCLVSFSPEPKLCITIETHLFNELKKQDHCKVAFHDSDTAIIISNYSKYTLKRNKDNNIYYYYYNDLDDGGVTINLDIV